MPFTPKDWRDSPETTTPINAAALEDLESRVTTYHGVHVSRAAKSIPTGGADYTFIDFDTEVRDTDGFWALSPNPTRLSCPAGGAGRYEVVAHGFYAPSAAGNYRDLGIIKNRDGVARGVDRIRPAGTGAGYVTVVAEVELAVGDYVEVGAYHDAGAALDFTTVQVTMRWLGRV